MSNLDENIQFYLEKNEYLTAYYESVSSYDFCRDLFPLGSFEREGHYEDEKPNGIALDIQGQGKVKTFVVTDGLEQLDELLECNFVVMSPIAYFGKRRIGVNARYLHAFTIDLDGVKMQNLRDLLYQMKNEILPKATYIVNSGTGFHLYYVLERPIPLYPVNQSKLKEFKYVLIRKIWNRYTSTIKDPQMQGIMQGFRVVGSASKLGKNYPVMAFRYGEKVSLEYLNSFVLLEKRIDLMHNKLSLEQAKKKYPDWYDKRIIKKEVKGRWTVKRDLYDWWLRRISYEIGVGHRYYGIMTLAIYAQKCGIDEDELRKDAYCLMERYDSISEDEDNRFTETDVISALESYNESFCTFPRDDIAKITGLEIKENKRNYQKQEHHLEEARMIRDLRMRRQGRKWDDNNGRPSKRQLIADYLAKNPNERNKSVIAKVTGVSRPTVYKYFDEIWGSI